MAASVGNDSLSALVVTGEIQLVDDHDNQASWDGDEVFYVESLEFGPESYVDLHGKKVYYVEAVVDSGATIVYNGGQLIPIIGGDAPEVGASAVDATRLFLSAPNPFRENTVIRFHLAEAGDVNLGIYDLTGRRVRDLLTSRRPAGNHTLVWDGRDRSGRAVSGGIYFLKLHPGGTMDSERLIRVR